jgi:hypothetical protein
LILKNIKKYKKFLEKKRSEKLIKEKGEIVKNFKKMWELMDEKG